MTQLSPGERRDQAGQTSSAKQLGGSVLMSQAQKKSPEEAKPFFTTAQEKLLQAESILPGSSAYDLACLFALQNDELECRRWLETSQKHSELPAKEHMEKDSDLHNVREQEWFIEFLKNL